MVRADGIHGNQTFHGALLEQTGILLDQVRTVPVTDDEIKVAVLEQLILNSSENQGRVALADLRDHHTDGKAALGA